MLGNRGTGMNRDDSGALGATMLGNRDDSGP